MLSGYARAHENLDEVTELHGRIRPGGGRGMSVVRANVLRQACGRVRLDHQSAELIREGGNVLYRLPDGAVARIARAALASALAEARRRPPGRDGAAGF